MINLFYRFEDIVDSYGDFCKNLSIYEQYISVYYEAQLNCNQSELYWHRKLQAYIEVSVAALGLGLLLF